MTTTCPNCGAESQYSIIGGHLFSCDTEQRVGALGRSYKCRMLEQTARAIKAEAERDALLARVEAYEADIKAAAHRHLSRPIRARRRGRRLCTAQMNPHEFNPRRQYRNPHARAGK